MALGGNNSTGRCVVAVHQGAERQARGCRRCRQGAGHEGHDEADGGSQRVGLISTRTTDITGGLLVGGDPLTETDSGQKRLGAAGFGVVVIRDGG